MDVALSQPRLLRAMHPLQRNHMLIDIPLLLRPEAPDPKNVLFPQGHSVCGCAFLHPGGAKPHKVGHKLGNAESPTTLISVFDALDAAEVQ